MVTRCRRGRLLWACLLLLVLSARFAHGAAADEDAAATAAEDEDELDDELEEESEEGGLGFAEVEEVEISSPQQVQKYWIAAIHDHLRKNKTLDLKPGGDMHKRGEAEARKRLRIRDKKSGRALSNALLAGGERVRALAAPDGAAAAGWEGNASAGGNGALVAPTAGEDGSGALVMTEMFNQSLELYGNISRGALANVGALRVNETARKKKPDLSPLDVVWNVVSELIEQNQTQGGVMDQHRHGGHHAKAKSCAAVAGVAAKAACEVAARKQQGKGKRRRPPQREAFPRAVDVAMGEWFTAKGGELFGGVEQGLFAEDAEGAGGGHAAGVGVGGGGPARPALLVGDEGGVAAGAAVMSIPIRVTLSQLSARNVKTATGYLGDRRHLKDAFAHNQQWALALMLLTQYYKNGAGDGEDSKWAPYLRTLRLATLTRAVTNELAGTYAAELMRTWEDEAELALTWLEENICKKHSREICQRDPKRAGSLPFSREDMKWSLGVVRSYAFWVTKRTTRKRFLALFPFSALVHHRHGAGGNCTLELDNSIRMYAGADFAAGSRFEFDRGDLTDAETLLTYKFVSTAPNPDNAVRLRLPGTQRSHPDMPLWWQTDILRDWRKALLLPPRTSDLWRSANALHLWGDDEDEEKEVQNRNNELARLGGDQHTPEEVLMLTGAAPDAESAALMVRGGRPENSAPQLYAVADPEDDEKAAEETTNLADQAAQLQRAFAADHRDPSVLKVINQTKMFFLHGIKPHAALDDVDTVLLRKMVLLEKCSNHSSHKLRFTEATDGGAGATADGADDGVDVEALLAESEDSAEEGEGGEGGEDEDEDEDDRAARKATAAEAARQRELEGENDLDARGSLGWALSPQLLCAVRVHVMNESEIELFCNKNLTKGPWTDVHCAEDTDKDGLRWAVAVSPENEHRTVEALRSSVAALLTGYPTTDEDDAPLLGMAPGTVPPITRAIVRLRLRERALLRGTIEALDARAAALKLPAGDAGSLRFQMHGREERQEDLRRRIEERAARGAALRERLTKPAPVVVMAVDLPSGAKANLTVLEGQDLKAAVRDFAVAHQLAQSALAVLETEARKRVPPASAEALALAHPVVVNGSRYILKVRSGENASAVAEDFCVMHGVPLERTPEVVAAANETYHKRALRPVVLTVPIDAPDGRKLTLQLRDGEQHEVRGASARRLPPLPLAAALPPLTACSLARSLARSPSRHRMLLLLLLLLLLPPPPSFPPLCRRCRCAQVAYAAQIFAEASKLGSIDVMALANVVFGRLPKAVMELPVQMGGQRTIVIRVAKGDDVPTLVTNFAQVHALDAAMELRIRHAVISGMNPGAYVVPLAL